MKKITKTVSCSRKEPVNDEEDRLFDFDDNLYNKPYEQESQTYRIKTAENLKSQTFSKKRKKVSFYENSQENHGDFS